MIPSDARTEGVPMFAATLLIVPVLGSTRPPRRRNRHHARRGQPLLSTVPILAGATLMAL